MELGIATPSHVKLANLQIFLVTLMELVSRFYLHSQLVDSMKSTQNREDAFVLAPTLSSRNAKIYSLQL